MAYYIFLDNGILNGAGHCPQLTEGVENIEVSEEVYNLYNESPEKYVYSVDPLEGVEPIADNIYPNPNYETEQAKKEEERVNNLTMTALDFITGLTKFGLTLEQINAYLESNLPLKMQLTYCQNVYCGVVKQLCPLSVGEFTLTSQLVEAMFLHKNGELSDDDLEAILHPVEVEETTPTEEPENNKEIEE